MYSPRATVAYRLTSRRSRRNRLLGTGSDGHDTRDDSTEINPLDNDSNIQVQNITAKDTQNNSDSYDHKYKRGVINKSFTRNDLKNISDLTNSESTKFETGAKYCSKDQHESLDRPGSFLRKPKINKSNVCEAQSKISSGIIDNANLCSAKFSTDTGNNISNSKGFIRSESARYRTQSADGTSPKLLRSKSFRESRSPKLGRVRKIRQSKSERERSKSSERKNVSLSSMRSGCKEIPPLRKYTPVPNQFRSWNEPMAYYKNLRYSLRGRSLQRQYSTSINVRTNSLDSCDRYSRNLKPVETLSKLNYPNPTIGNTRELSLRRWDSSLPNLSRTRSEISEAGRQHAIRNVLRSDLTFLSDTGSLFFRSTREGEVNKYYQSLSAKRLNSMNSKTSQNSRGILKLSPKNFFSKSFSSNISTKKSPIIKTSIATKPAKVGFAIDSRSTGLKREAPILSSTSLIAAVEQLHNSSKVTDCSISSCNVIAPSTNETRRKDSNAQVEGAVSDVTIVDALPTYQYGASLPDKYQPMWPKATKDC